MSEPARFWRSATVVLGAGILGTTTFLVLLYSRDVVEASSGRPVNDELGAGLAVAGVLAFAASLIFLRSGFVSFLYGVAAAVLVYPLYWVYFALWVAACLVGIHDCSDALS